ncbi:MAG: hypothetical protein DRP87_11670 [Spirochaetes bacterium]|nr:MAG: hypothetical protein DRP87_11670 [Spirochaetota bacterium]
MLLSPQVLLFQQIFFMITQPQPVGGETRGHNSSGCGYDAICYYDARLLYFTKILYLVAAMPRWAIYSRDFIFLPKFLNAKKQNLP